MTTVNVSREIAALARRITVRASEVDKNAGDEWGELEAFIVRELTERNPVQAQRETSEPITHFAVVRWANNTGLDWLITAQPSALQVGLAPTEEWADGYAENLNRLLALAPEQPSVAFPAMPTNPEMEAKADRFFRERKAARFAQTAEQPSEQGDVGRGARLYGNYVDALMAARDATPPQEAAEVRQITRENGAKDTLVKWRIDNWGLQTGTKLYLAPPANDEAEREMTAMIVDRDRVEAIADKLAYAIAEYFDVDIGEHSSANDPWDNALEEIQSQRKPEDQT